MPFPDQQPDDPETWRTLNPRSRPCGAHQGVTYLTARQSLAGLAEHYQALGAALEDAHANGFRLHDVADDDGLIYLVRGPVTR